LSGYGGTVVFDPSKLSQESKRLLQQAEILITEPHVLAKLLLLLKKEEKENESSSSPSSSHPLLLSNLKWCQSTYAGVDPVITAIQNHDTTPLSLPPFVLTRFAGVFGPPMAEWCLGRIIAHERNFAASHQDQHDRQWRASASSSSSSRQMEYRYLSELTLTVLGATGDIGQCICQMAKAMGMHKVVGYSSSSSRQRSSSSNSDTTTTTTTICDEYTNDLADALRQADYVVSVLPSTPATRGLLSLETLRAAANKKKKSPVLINVGRGDLITTDTLLTALQEEHLSAAILDVMEQEPLPSDSPLWTHPQVVISPHVSALTRGKDVPKLVLEQLERYQHDPTSLRYVVDWNKGY
jgi:phosphoglycerate dehydrogenase-like enzyme